MTTDALPYAEFRWERAENSRPIDDAWIRERLAAWPELASREWTVLGGGLRSLNVRVGDVVARIACGRSEREVLAKEAAALRRFTGRLPVPEVVDSRDGVLLTHFVGHQPLPGSAVAADCVGRAAALLHRTACPNAGFFDGRLHVREPLADTWSFLVAWSGAAMTGGRWPLDRERAAAIAECWRRADDDLREACSVACFLHGDFKPANLKWRPDTGDVVAFDWEFCWAGPALLDVGQLLRWGVPPKFEESFSHAYETHGGVLPPRWRRTAELLDLMNLIGFVDRAEPGSQCRRDVLGRIGETLASRG